MQLCVCVLRKKLLSVCMLTEKATGHNCVGVYSWHSLKTTGCFLPPYRRSKKGKQGRGIRVFPQIIKMQTNVLSLCHI